MHKKLAEFLCKCYVWFMVDFPRLDASAVRVLAHPLRNRLLGQLRLEGPATATTLAHVLETNTGATSYHLRKLADVGLVRDTGTGNGRERVWQAAHEGHSWFESDFDDDPDSQAASEWLQGDYLRQSQERYEAWQRVRSDWPVEWREPAGMSDYFCELSAQQFRALTDEIADVIVRYRTAGPDGDAERVFIYVQAFPERRQET